MGAKLWLDWTREILRMNNGDDPLGGRIFPHVWTRGDDPDPERMKLAALALRGYDCGIREQIDFLKAARARAKESDQVSVDLLLAQAVATTKEWALFEEASIRLLAATRDRIRHCGM